MQAFDAGLLRAGAFMAACVLMLPTALSAADCGPASLETTVLERVTPEGELILQDSRRIRLAGLHLGSVNADHWPRAGETIAIGLLSDGKDRWSRLPAMVFTVAEGQPPEWLQQRLIERGAALVRPEADLDGCWPMLTQAEAKAEAALPKPAAEPGRFARISGRVQRVGDGRSAHFINLYDRSGERVTGLVQKRNLKRFKDAGVDVTQLRGQFIRIRGIRSATNATVIPLTQVEQIEIVR
jgi:hypothetical protein